MHTPNPNPCLNLLLNLTPQIVLIIKQPFCFCEDHGNNPHNVSFSYACTHEQACTRTLSPHRNAHGLSLSCRAVPGDNRGAWVQLHWIPLCCTVASRMLVLDLPLSISCLIIQLSSNCSYLAIAEPVILKHWDSRKPSYVKTFYEKIKIGHE